MMKKRLSSNTPQPIPSKPHQRPEDNDSTHQEGDFKHKTHHEKYFETSSSEGSDLHYPKQEIVERTKDNSFGRFEELLGAGVFKRVYRGYDFNAGREIAWSVINITCSSTSQKSYEKITEEVNILQQINHPNIIHFITGWLDEEKKQVIIITELVSGGSLKENLKRIKEPRLRLVKKWIKQILGGLDYLHKKDIIHRDLKCANIFLDNFFGNVKIGDLGGSELLYRKYGTNYGGTKEFMAPEIVEGRYTVKADIYSLGMSVIEMLTHERPYKECDGPMAIYYNITHGIYPESLNKIDNENMVTFIKLCLRRECQRPSAQELLLNEYLNDELSEENNHPVKIINNLRQNNISSKYQNEIKPLQSMPLTISTVNVNGTTGNNDICRKENAIVQTKPFAPMQLYDRQQHQQQQIPKDHYQVSVFSPAIAKKSTYDYNNNNNDGISAFTAKDNNSTPKHDRKEYRKALSNRPFDSASAHQVLHPDDNSPINSKTSLFKKKPSSSFVITIKETPHHRPSIEKEKEKDMINHINNTTISNDLNSSPSFPSNPLNSSEIEISFVISRDEWKNKKRLICPYNFDTDTVDGLASELKSAINLNDEEYQIVRNKLNESITKYTSASSCSSQRNTLSSVSQDTKIKGGKYEDFLLAYHSLYDSVKSILYNDKTKRLDEIANGKSSMDFLIKLEGFKRKEKCLLNIINQTTLSTCK